MEVGRLNSNADLISRYNQNMQITTENKEANDEERRINEQDDLKNKINIGTANTDKINNDENQGDEAAYDKKDLDKAVNKLNKFLEDDKTRAELSYHDRLKTLMVKIVDEKTDKVILEVPPEKVLDMVASMCEQVGILDKKA